ncbi:MAG: MFS transporter [Acidobacteria bacterium]|nr:MFS transporter [Acidobacteriota bacterium]
MAPLEAISHGGEVRVAGRRKLLAAAAAGIFMFGVVMALLGATLLPLAQRIHLDSGRAGDLFLVMNFGIFLALVLSGPAFDRFGTRPVLLVSALLLAGGLLVLAAAGNVPRLGLAVFVIGLGGGGLNTGANALVSDAYAEGRGPALNVLGIFFGFGAVALPFYALLAFPPAREARGFRLREALGVARNPRVLLFAFLLFFQSGNEFTMGGWISSFVAKETGASVRFATLALTGYWAAMMLGRLLSARLLRHVRDANLVIASGALAALATALLLAARSPGAAAGAVALIGFAYAAIYPTTLGMAGDRFPRFLGTVFGVLFSIALIGGMSFPWAAGHLAQASGFRAGLALPLLGATGVALLGLVILRTSPSPSVGIMRE